MAAASFAAEQPFVRYQTIIDRKPFGPEPVNFDPEATPGTSGGAGGGAEGGEMTPEQRTAEEQQLASSVRVSILNVTPSGAVKVGFTDLSAKPPDNYYLAVGASQNGWTVKAADPSTESVTLAKEGIEVTVKLGETSGGGGKGGAQRGRPIFQRGGNGGTSGAAAEAPGNIGGGLARLRRQRMEMKEREREDAERKREADAAAKAEREEREAREAEEKQRAAEERAQQREALLQIQEQLKRAREEREAAKRQQEQQEGQQEGQGESDDNTN